jgi:2-polyprenyl-3-methyl-5-hydroxy-6-metoxy-1,4-benzoquinol methylase
MSVDSKITRPCIICSSEHFDEKFTYTYEFMTQVRGHDGARLAQQGWVPGATSTIVKCCDCGCCYVRDVLRLPAEYMVAEIAKRAAPDALGDYIRKVRNAETFKRYRQRDQMNWMVRNTISLAAERQGRDIRMLDFGAGGGQACNAARANGVRDVIAYDPYFVDTTQEYYNATNYSGILCISTPEELAKKGPYDAVIFQSAIEHVMDPRAELQLIFENMTQGGYLYVNNPVMNLDAELAQLTAANKISKRDAINHYHPWHLNYMMPREFERMLQDIGFKILPMGYHTPAVPGAGAVRRRIAVTIKASIRWIQNILGLPYTRYVYYVQKP